MTKQSTESLTLTQARELLPETEHWIHGLMARLGPKLPQPPLDVLDVGSAQGRALVVLARLGHRPSGVEPWEAALEVSREFLRDENVDADVRLGRAEAIPFENESFDLVLAMSVMEHVEDLDAALAEIHRVLRPGGVFWFNSASALSMRQSEIDRFPLFGWYPDALKQRVMAWAKKEYPHLIGHTDTPALHWWTPARAHRKLGEAGFGEIWDRWELRTEDETSPRARPFLRLAKASRVARLLGDVLVEGQVYAARKSTDGRHLVPPQPWLRRRDVAGAGIRLLRSRNPRLADEVAWLRERRHNPVYRAVEHLVRPGSVVVDIGASHGYFAARLQRLVGPGGFVHAFEPNPEAAAALRRRATPRLRVHAVALSDRQGTATLRVPVLNGTEHTGMGSLEAPATKHQVAMQEVTVPVERLSDVLGTTEQLDFVKCDVEGHEHAVLQGSLQLLERFKPALLIEIEQRHRDRDVRETFRLLEDLGYAGWAFFASGLRPLSAFNAESDQMQFSREHPTRESMPDAYVNDFLFVPPDVDVNPLLDSTWTGSGR